MNAVEGSGSGGGGVPGGEQLLRFTEASATGDTDQITSVRNDVVASLGPEVMVDAAAVASAFQMMNRIANATGTQLDDQLQGVTAGVQEQLELDYLSAPNKPAGELS